MNFKGAIAGVMGLAASLSVSAQTIDYGSFVLDFDATTELGTPHADFSGAGGRVNLSWAIPTSVHVITNGDSDFAEYALPSFTITVNQGYRLHGAVTGFLGNLVFNEFGETQTFAMLDGVVSVDEYGPLALAGDMTRTETTVQPGVFTGGFYAATAIAPLGDFSSLSFADGHLTLIVFGTGSILAQPQNEMKLSFFAAPVPVPTAVWLFGSALSGLACVWRRKV